MDQRSRMKSRTGSSWWLGSSDRAGRDGMAGDDNPTTYGDSRAVGSSTCMFRPRATEHRRLLPDDGRGGRSSGNFGSAAHRFDWTAIRVVVAG